MSTKQSWASLKKRVEQLFQQSLQAFVPTLDNLHPLIGECRFVPGDYQCNAFYLFRKIKNFSTPEKLAQAIKKNMPKSEMIESCFVESAWVIVVVSRKWLATNIEKMLIEGIQSWAPRLPITRAVIHFTEPTVGDFRSTIISDSLTKILEFCGVEVLEGGRVDDSNKQGGEPKCQKAHDQICETSRSESKNTHKRRRVFPDRKVCNPDIPGVSDGSSNKALIEDVPFFNLQEDGPLGNLEQGLAVLRHYVEEEEADWIIFVADDDLREEIRNLFYCAKRAGLHSGEDGAYPKVTHAGYGLLRQADGELFHLQRSSTYFFNEAKNRARKELIEQGINEDLSPHELDKTAELVGHGAVRYFDLKWHRLCNYEFSSDEMLNLEGSFLNEYDCVCMTISELVDCGDEHELGGNDIKQLVNEDIEQLKKGGVLVLDHEDEWELGVQLLRFSEIVKDACSSLCPNIICEYMLPIPSQVECVFEHCKAKTSSEKRRQRLLFEAARVVMRKSFELLGITPVNYYGFE